MGNLHFQSSVLVFCYYSLVYFITISINESFFDQFALQNHREKKPKTPRGWANAWSWSLELGFWGGEIAVKSDGWIGVLVMAWRRPRRGDKTLWKHDWERPGVEVVGVVFSLHSLQSLLSVLVEFLIVVRRERPGILDVQNLVLSDGCVWRRRRSSGIDLIGRGSARKDNQEEREKH